MEEQQAKEIQFIIEQTIKAVHKDMRKRQEAYCYQNTKLLLENYNLLKDHVEYAISSPGDVKPITEKISDMEYEFFSDYDEDFMSQKPDVFIDSILASRVRTALMVAHIDSMAKKLYDEAKDNPNEFKKFTVFYDLYFNELSCEDIAKKTNYSTSQVYRICNDMTEKLSVLLWGANGLRWLV